MRELSETVVRDKARLIEQLWSQLATLGWSPSTHARLVAHLGELAGQCGASGHPEISSIVRELAQRLPSVSERSLMVEQAGIGSLVKRLHDGVEQIETHRVTLEQGQRPRVWLLLRTRRADLVRRLEERDFVSNQLFSKQEIDQALVENPPAAMIVDVDFGAQRGEGILMAEALQRALGYPVPVVFLARKNQDAERIAAVKAGGVAYLIEPLENDRVLAPLCNLLEPLRMAAKTPSVVIFGMPDFDLSLLGDAQLERLSDLDQLPASIARQVPELALIDMDLGLEAMRLYRLIRLWPAAAGLPVVLIARDPVPAMRLVQACSAYDDVLTHPVDSDYLAWFVGQRVAQARAYRDQIRRLASRDRLTGLQNREAFLAQLGQRVAQPGCEIGLGLILLDGMHLLRQELDPAQCDELIAVVARVLQAASELPLARFGELVFAVRTDDGGLLKLRTMADRLRRSLSESKDQNLGLAARLTLRVGACYKRPGLVLQRSDLIHRADLALEQARHDGRSLLVVEAAEAAQEEADAAQRVRSEILEAVERSRMAVAFQPIVSLKGDACPRFEMLLRLSNHDGHELLPQTVFKVVLGHRVALLLDRWVLGRCVQILRQSSTNQLSLFVNLGRDSLTDDSLLSWMTERLIAASVAPGGMILELDERDVAHHMDAALRLCRGLNGLGCLTSLQHFGGVLDDPFATAEQLGVRYIKPDPGLLHAAIKDTGSRDRLTQWSRRADELGMQMIASGVEDVAILPSLWASGIPFVQGHFMQAPAAHMDFDFANASP